MFRSLKTKKNGFSLLEVIIAALIFTISAAGLLTAISMTRRPAQTSTAKVQAMFRLKQTLDSLAGQVSAATWSDPASNLYPGVYTFSEGMYNITYAITYATADPNGPRKITADISFPD